MPLMRRRRRSTLDELSDAAVLVWRRSRRVVVFVVGVTILALSIPVGLLPGPGGIAVAIAGLALLATEFLWARRLLRRARSGTAAFADVIVGRKPRLWLIPIVVPALIIAIAAALEVWPERRAIVWGASSGPIIGVAVWAGLSLYRWKYWKQANPTSADKEQPPNQP